MIKVIERKKSNLNEIMGSVLECICPQCNEKYTRFVSDDNFCADDFDPNKPEIMQTGFACDIDTNRIVYFSLCPRCGYKFWQDGRQKKTLIMGIIRTKMIRIIKQGELNKDIKKFICKCKAI